LQEEKGGKEQRKKNLLSFKLNVIASFQILYNSRFLSGGNEEVREKITRDNLKSNKNYVHNKVR
jgi:hypothetical protein